jgi:hypothetical protein
MKCQIFVAIKKYEEKKGSEFKKYHGTDSEDNFKESRKHRILHYWY